MRKNYEKPTINVTEFACENIILASGEVPVGFADNFSLTDDGSNGSIDF